MTSQLLHGCLAGRRLATSAFGPIANELAGILNLESNLH
jgi:hypothetical protein